jgi:hypothetical protein
LGAIGSAGHLRSGTPVGGVLASAAAGEAGKGSSVATGWLGSRPDRTDAFSLRAYSTIAALTVQMLPFEAISSVVGSLTNASVHLSFGSLPASLAGSWCWHQNDGGEFSFKTAIVPSTCTDVTRFHGMIAACATSFPASIKNDAHVAREKANEARRRGQVDRQLRRSDGNRLHFADVLVLRRALVRRRRA